MHGPDCCSGASVKRTPGLPYVLILPILRRRITKTHQHLHLPPHNARPAAAQSLNRLPFTSVCKKGPQRPDGNMDVLTVLWWKHKPWGPGSFRPPTCKVSNNGAYTLDSLDGLKPEELDGF